MRCVALASQQNIRDLQLLPELMEEVEWLDAEKMVLAPEPAVICGVWLTEEPEKAKSLLLRRSTQGQATLIVPRFRGGDLRGLFDSPVAVEVRAAEANSVTWENGEQYSVSAVSYIDTALHVGRWGKTPDGLGVLCYRPNTSAGPIVLCTAAIVGRAIGIRRAEQSRLLCRIFEEMGKARVVEKEEGGRAANVGAAPDLETFLREKGADGAALLLSLLACGGDREADLITAAREQFGIELSEGTVSILLKRLPEMDLKSVEEALRQFGWGAFVRRVLELNPKEGQDE